MQDKSEDAAPQVVPPPAAEPGPLPVLQPDTAQGAPAAADTSVPEPAVEPAPHVVVTSDGEAISEAFIGEMSVVKRAVDIIFAMDTSGSMSQEKASLEANMSKFIEQFEVDAKGVDYQVFMIGQNFNFPAGSESVVKVEREVDSHDALRILQRFFDGDFEVSRPLRPDAMKQIVIITDDDAWGVSSQQFNAFIQGKAFLRDKTSVNGIVGLETSVENDACEVEHVGEEYIELASNPATSGLIQDLCSQDWATLLKQLADKIIQQSRKAHFELDQLVDASSELVVTVEGEPVDARFVTYDESQNAVIFAPGHEPPAGAEIVVTYTPKD